jgi:two-component system, chemotaxis family, protein-glutamate methylesterase/glutaminase
VVRVLIADDSSTEREQVMAVLRTDPMLEVIGEACNGVQAVDLAQRLHPDIIVMNVAMPRANGLEATKTIMVELPTPIVILSDQASRDEVELSMHALRAGALAVCPKPWLGNTAMDNQAAEEFIHAVKAMAQVKLVRRWKEQAITEPARLDRHKPLVVAVAASTGGPAALQRLLADLPNNFPLPMLAVQHIANGFVGGLADWLNTNSAVRVRLARAGEELRERTLYIAPDDRHLGVSPDWRVCLAASDPICGFRPSANYLLASVAQAFGRSAVAVILTGMGEDGVDGLRSVRRAGGIVLAQDEATSVVFGMPRAAIEAGLADAVLPLPEIAPRLLALTR